MKILSSSHTAFWGDIPAPNYWWNILHRFSEGILYIMTDIDDNRWLTSRRAMCSKKSPTWEWTVPLAFHPNELHFSDKTLSEERKENLTKSFLLDTNVWTVDNITNKLYFDAYRRFVLCAIPPVKLLWIHMGKDTSSVFWKKLNNFMGLNLTNEKLNLLIQGGVPYLGSKGCFIGKNNCKYKLRVSNPVPNVCM